jgi:hypothetical protein
MLELELWQESKQAFAMGDDSSVVRVALYPFLRCLSRA